ncbi:unnamed protein product [Larinioides sclopetarius]|uniref:Uncharacterized protein n=1 Tax=Larinioides sclopetarius TaxID=280406 RepID=A0AAV2BIU6_9ARAC
MLCKTTLSTLYPPKN